MAALLLRLASVVALLQALAHTLLVVFAAPRHGPQEIAVIEAMKAHRFDFMGSARSYWESSVGNARKCLLASACRQQKRDDRGVPTPPRHVERRSPLSLRPLACRLNPDTCVHVRPPGRRAA
jgi:hypothetical protein